MAFFAIATAVVVVDQLVKAWVVGSFTIGVPVDVIGEWVRIWYVMNTGALFGLFRDQAVIFAVLSIGVMALIIWYHGRAVVSSGWLATVALGLLLGGAVGNFIDRVRLGLRRRLRGHGDPGRVALLHVERRRRRHHDVHPPAPADGDPAHRAPRDPGRMTELRLVVPAGGGGRADRFAADLSGLSRSRVQRLITEGRVTADGLPVKANTVVAPGAVLVIDVPPPEPAGIEAEAIPLDVVFEDDDVIVVNKPAGLVVHPSPGHWSGTLVNALLARDTEYGGIAGVERPGIVHRLDRDTSGLLMVAKTDAAQASLMAQLKARRVKKTYLALVQGSVRAAVGRIEAPVGRDPRNRMRMAVTADGKPSVTGYRVRERFADWTLLELDLVTGRTHQIRVHLAALGHPVAGDPVYGTGTSRRGPDDLGRLFLHAWRLVFAAPATGELVRLEAALPAELEGVLVALRAAGADVPPPPADDADPR